MPTVLTHKKHDHEEVTQHLRGIGVKNLGQDTLKRMGAGESVKIPPKTEMVLDVGGDLVYRIANTDGEHSKLTLKIDKFPVSGGLILPGGVVVQSDGKTMFARKISVGDEVKRANKVLENVATYLVGKNKSAGSEQALNEIMQNKGTEDDLKYLGRLAVFCEETLDKVTGEKVSSWAAEKSPAARLKEDVRELFSFSDMLIEETKKTPQVGNLMVWGAHESICQRLTQSVETDSISKQVPKPIQKVTETPKGNEPQVVESERVKPKIEKVEKEVLPKENTVSDISDGMPPMACGGISDSKTHAGISQTNDKVGSIDTESNYLKTSPYMYSVTALEDGEGRVRNLDTDMRDIQDMPMRSDMGKLHNNEADISLPILEGKGHTPIPCPVKSHLKAIDIVLDDGTKTHANVSMSRTGRYFLKDIPNNAVSIEYRLKEGRKKASSGIEWDHEFGKGHPMVYEPRTRKLLDILWEKKKSPQERLDLVKAAFDENHMYYSSSPQVAKVLSSAKDYYSFLEAFRFGQCTQNASLGANILCNQGQPAGIAGCLVPTGSDFFANPHAITVAAGKDGELYYTDLTETARSDLDFFPEKLDASKKQEFFEKLVPKRKHDTQSIKRVGELTEECFDWKQEGEETRVCMEDKSDSTKKLKKESKVKAAEDELDYIFNPKDSTEPRDLTKLFEPYRSFYVQHSEPLFEAFRKKIQKTVIEDIVAGKVPKEQEVEVYSWAAKNLNIIGATGEPILLELKPVQDCIKQMDPYDQLRVLKRNTSVLSFAPERLETKQVKVLSDSFDCFSKAFSAKEGDPGTSYGFQKDQKSVAKTLFGGCAFTTGETSGLWLEMYDSARTKAAIPDMDVINDAFWMFGYNIRKNPEKIDDGINRFTTAMKKFNLDIVDVSSTGLVTSKDDSLSTEFCNQAVERVFWDEHYEGWCDASPAGARAKLEFEKRVNGLVTPKQLNEVFKPDLGDVIGAHGRFSRGGGINFPAIEGKHPYSRLMSEPDRRVVANLSHVQAMADYGYLDPEEVKDYFVADEKKVAKDVISSLDNATVREDIGSLSFRPRGVPLWFYPLQTPGIRDNLDLSSNTNPDAKAIALINPNCATDTHVSNIFTEIMETDNENWGKIMTKMNKRIEPLSKSAPKTALETNLSPKEIQSTVASCLAFIHQGDGSEPDLVVKRRDWLKAEVDRVKQIPVEVLKDDTRLTQEMGKRGSELDTLDPKFSEEWNRLNPRQQACFLISVGEDLKNTSDTGDFKIPANVPQESRQYLKEFTHVKINEPVKNAPPSMTRKGAVFTQSLNYYTDYYGTEELVDQAIKSVSKVLSGTGRKTTAMPRTLQFSELGHGHLRKDGSGDFADMRQYHQGDDLKNIDWNIWGRSDQLIVKERDVEQQAPWDIKVSQRWFNACGKMKGTDVSENAVKLMTTLVEASKKNVSVRVGIYKEGERTEFMSEDEIKRDMKTPQGRRRIFGEIVKLSVASRNMIYAPENALTLTPTIGKEELQKGLKKLGMHTGKISEIEYEKIDGGQWKIKSEGRDITLKRNPKSREVVAYEGEVSENKQIKTLLGDVTLSQDALIFRRLPKTNPFSTDYNQLGLGDDDRNKWRQAAVMALVAKDEYKPSIESTGKLKTPGRKVYYHQLST